MDKTFCKLCLQNNSILISIYQEDCKESLSIPTIIKKYFPSSDTNQERTSNYICTECWNKLKDFHLFYLYINEIHESMQESHAFAINMQTEPDIEYIKLENSYVLLTDCKDEKFLDVPDIKMEDEIQADIPENIKCRIPLNENIEIKDSQDLNQSDDDDNFLDDDVYIETPIPKIPITEIKKKLRISTLAQKPKLIIKKKKKLKTKTVNKVKETVELKKELPISAMKIRMTQDHELVKEYCNMTCDLCSTTFDNNGLIEARKHYREAHGLTGYLRCCKIKFFKRALIMNHIEKHRNPDICFKCSECNRKYLTKYSLQDHFKEQHAPDKNWEYNCDKCNKRFPTACRLTKHSFIHVPYNERKHICDVCKKAFVTHDHLHSHKKIHTNTEVICEICARIFKNKNTLLCHLKYEHTDKELIKAQCDVCGKWLSNDIAVQQHKRRIHNTIIEEFKCPHCDKIKTNKYTLKRHIEFTHGERKHKCTLCDKSFQRSLALKEHLAVHTGEDLYTCQFCSQTFKSSANMYAHRKKVHVEQYSQHINNQLLNKPITNN